MSTEGESLIGGHGSASGLGEARNDVTVSAEVALATNKDNRSVGGGGADLGAPEVKCGEECGRVGDLVAEHEDISLAEREVTGSAA